MKGIYPEEELYSVEEAIKTNFENASVKWLECERIQMWNYYHLEATQEEISKKAVTMGYNAFVNKKTGDYYISKCSASTIIDDILEENSLFLKEGDMFELTPIEGCKAAGVGVIKPFLINHF